MWIETVAAFAAGIITGLLLYRSKEKPGTPVGDVRQCVTVIWCSHCGMPGSALCQAHKLPVAAP